MCVYVCVRSYTEFRCKTETPYYKPIAPYPSMLKVIDQLITILT